MELSAHYRVIGKVDYTSILVCLQVFQFNLNKEKPYQNTSNK